MILALLLTLALPATAKEIDFIKRVDPTKLHAELTASGFTVTRLSCVNSTHCRLAVAENKDPEPVVSAHVYVNPKAARQAESKALEAVVKKVEEGTASQQERDQLLLILIKKHMSTKKE